MATVVAVLGVVEPSVAIDVDVEPNGPSVVVDAGMVVVVVVDSVSVVGETTMDVVVVGSPLEVIDQNSDRNERYVTPLMGKSSHWYRNVIANGPVEGTIRNETFRFTWRQAAQEEAQAVLENDRQRHPRYTRFIIRTVGRLDGLPNATPPTIAEALPVLALRAVQPRA